MTAALAIGAINPQAQRAALERLGHVLGTADETALLPERGRSHSLLRFTRLLEGAAASIARPHLGLEMADAELMQQPGVFAELFCSAPTVGRLLEDLVRFFPVVQTGTAVSLEHRRNQVRFIYEIVDPSIDSKLQDAAYTLGRICRGLKRAAAGWKLDAVTLAHPDPGSGAAAVFARFFCSPVSFDAAVTALCLPSSCLEAPIATADPGRYAQYCRRMNRLAPTRATPGLLEDALRAWLARNGPGSGATLERACADFGITLRTMQRRLKTQGLSFARLRAQQRMERAEALLRERRLSVTAIAEQLGYSETSAFTRAFYAHASQSPRAFRAHCDAPGIVVSGQVFGRRPE